TFVREIAKFAAMNGIKCSYYHRNDPHLLDDIDNLEFTTEKPPTNEHMSHYQVNDTMYLNTWYASGNYKYYRTYGMSYNCLYHLFNEYMGICFNVSLKHLSNDFDY